MKKNILVSYTPWIVAAWVLVLILRIIEILLLKQHQTITHLLINECIGLGIDIVLISAFLAVAFPVYYLFFRTSVKAANVFIGIVVAFLAIAHLSIIEYFATVLKPLGGILLEHSSEEVLFTIRTSGTNYFMFGVLVLVSLSIFFVAKRLLNKIRFSTKCSYVIFSFSVLSIIFTLLINRSFQNIEKEALPYSLRINKSQYFYHHLGSVLFPTGGKNIGNIDLSERALLFPNKDFVSKEYPLLSKTDTNDVLGAFLNKTTNEQPPNIVVLVVEGLGSRFMHNFHGMELMPFVDSIAAQSLYWDKALTAGERSFSAVPSLLASAPYGKKNFASENGKAFSLSLINMLSKYNYYSTLFYGQPKWFHDKGAFLRRNGIDKIVDSYDYPAKYHKIMVGDYFWGYHDQDLVKHSLEIINDSLPDSPRIDLYFTGSMYQPFIIDNEAEYNKRLDVMAQKSGLSKEEKAFVKTYQKNIRTVLYTDDALRKLFAGYREHPSFENTIFIITGDHPMAEIPIENVYRRYCVPLIIYSPLIKQPKTFHSVNSHLDIMPSLMAFLHKNYDIAIPEQNAFIGKVLDTASYFRNIQPIVFMNDNRDIVDILFENYFLSNGQTLYKVSENDEIAVVNDTALQHKIASVLKCFKALNTYCCTNYKLIPDDIFYQYTGNQMLFESVNRTYKMSDKQEYGCDIIPETEIAASGQYYFDFVVKSNVQFKKNMPTLVLEAFYPETGEREFWQGTSLQQEEGRVRSTFDIQKKGNKKLLIKSYFWNEGKVDFKLSKANCHLYRLEKQSSK